MQLYWVNLLTYHDIQKYKSLSNEMLKDVSGVLESSVPNSKEIKIKAADVPMNVNLPKTQATRKVIGAVPNGT